MPGMPMTCPAALKRKLTIDPIRPGSAEAAFAPRVLRPFANCLPMAFSALVIVPTTASIVTPVVRKMAVTVIPYFLKISFFSQRGLSSTSPRSRSVALIRVVIHSLSLSYSAILPSAVSLS